MISILNFGLVVDHCDRTPDDFSCEESIVCISEVVKCCIRDRKGMVG